LEVGSWKLEGNLIGLLKGFLLLDFSSEKLAIIY